MQITWDIGWFWFCTIVIGVLLTISPVIWSRHRMAYVAALTTLGLILVGAVWARDWGRREHVSVFVRQRHTASLDSFSLGSDSGGGGLGLWWEHNRIIGSTLKYYTSDNGGRPQIVWNCFPKEPTRAYPALAMRTRLFDCWGFRAYSDAWPERPNGITIVQIWLMVVPNWFVMFTLSVPAFFAWRKVLNRAKIRRWLKLGRCMCGYDLRAHNPGDLCPECATPVPPRKPTPAARPATTA